MQLGPIVLTSTHAIYTLAIPLGLKQLYVSDSIEVKTWKGTKCGHPECSSVIEFDLPIRHPFREIQVLGSPDRTSL